MFGSQSLRLLRDKWSSARDLAMELYAMFQDKNPVETSGGLTVSRSSGGPALTIKGSTFGGQSAISFGGGSGDPAIAWDPGSNDLSLTAQSITFSTPDGGLNIGDPSSPSNIKNLAASSTSGGGGVPAQILSGGPGASYVADVYPAGPSGASTSAAVTILQIDPGETVPAGTWLVVTQVGTSYYGQVPVWL